MAGMQESEFFGAELWQVQNRISAWGNLMNREEKAALQRTSLLGAWVLNMAAAKGKTIKPEDLLPSVWEGVKANKPRPLTPEERAKRFAAHDAIIRKRHANG